MSVTLPLCEMNFLSPPESLLLLPLLLIYFCYFMYQKIQILFVFIISDGTCSIVNERDSEDCDSPPLSTATIQCKFEPLSLFFLPPSFPFPQEFIFSFFLHLCLIVFKIIRGWEVECTGVIPQLTTQIFRVSESDTGTLVPLGEQTTDFRQEFFGKK